MSLHDFIRIHRDELLQLTSAKVAVRRSPQPTADQVKHGVPAFLSQVAEALDHEEGTGASRKGQAAHSPNQGTTDDILRSATLHGQDLRTLGFTIDQVVHGYGDVCQAVTELALERESAVTTAEFRTLNRCLDNAIAGAVLSWSSEPRGARPLDPFEQELGAQLDIATASFAALRSGHVGSNGATSSNIERSLTRMRALIDDPTRKR